jgi:hypothetical protein
MLVELTEVSKGRRGIALAPTTLTYRSGAATLAIAETEQRPTVLGLIATGRMRTDSGSVRVDGSTRLAALRRRTALVDAPDVSEPAPNIAVAGVVGEELMFAGRLSDPLSARRWLDEHGMRHLSRVPIGDIDPLDRLRLLLELAALRPGVEAVVLVSPDRHGGDPAQWWRLAQEFARRSLAVLVIAGSASAQVVADTPSRPARPGIRPSSLRLRHRVGGTR